MFLLLAWGVPQDEVSSFLCFLYTMFLLLAWGVPQDKVSLYFLYTMFLLALSVPQDKVSLYFFVHHVSSSCLGGSSR